MTKILKRIEDLMLSDAYTNSSNPKHKEVTDEVSKYFKENFKDGPNTKKKYKWVSEKGDHTCETCSLLDGKLVDNKEDFGVTFPVHPNCKCEIIEVWVEEEDDVDEDRVGEIKMSDSEFINKIFPNIKKFEGERFYTYTDTKGFVTIGYGNKISSKKEIKKLPLYIGDRLATDKEKEDEFDKLNGNSNKSGILRLTNTVIRNMAENHLKNDLEEVRRKFNEIGVNFDTLPMKVKEVIIDMQYNMGGYFTSYKFKDKNGEHGWPNFFRAIRDRDWKTASEQCKSEDIQEDRNNWRQDKLLSIIE